MDRTIVILVAVLLALNFVAVPLLGRRLASRRRAASGLGERAGRNVDGYASILLSRLVVQACRILALDRACLLVSDAGDPDRLVAVVGHGVDEDVIGSRMPVDGPLLAALHSGEPQRIDASVVLPGSGGGAAVTAAAGSSPQLVVLWAATERGCPELDERGVMLLHELANLCSSAIDDLAVKDGLGAELRARAEQLTADRGRERTSRGAPRLDLASLASQIGARLRLERGALIELELAARVIETETAPGRMAAAERLACAPGLEVVTLIVRFVRERWDGRGLLGLPGEQIPLASRILAVCDAARMLTAEQPAGAGATVETAVRHIQGASGSIFDPTVVTALTHELIGDMPGLGGHVMPAADWARADSQYVSLR
jgi:HD domain